MGNKWALEILDLDPDVSVHVGKGVNLDVDIDRFEIEARKHIFMFGLRQMLADAHAAMGKDEDDYVNKSRVLAERKLAALYAGELRVNGERGPRLDPVEGEARRIALGQVQAQIRAGLCKIEGVVNRKVSSYTTKQILTLVTKRLTDNPKIMIAAKNVVRDRMEAE